MKQQPFLLIVLLVLGLAEVSRAEIFFNNLSQGLDGSASFNDQEDLLATDFLTDGSPRTITRIVALLGNSSDLFTYTVTFGIYADNGGSPGALLSNFDTGISLGPESSGAFTATSSGINLQSNTPYWVVGQVDLNPDLNGRVTWRYDSGQGTDGSPYSTVAGTQRQLSSFGLGYIGVGVGNYMFALGTIPIPEPSTLPILVSVGALGGWHRRRCCPRRRRSYFYDGLPGFRAHLNFWPTGSSSRSEERR